MRPWPLFVAAIISAACGSDTLPPLGDAGRSVDVTRGDTLPPDRGAPLDARPSDRGALADVRKRDAARPDAARPDAARPDRGAVADARVVLPPNDRCASAQPIVVSRAGTTVRGTTVGATNEFKGLRCTGGTTYDGPQLYYRFSAIAGRTYSITVAPTWTIAYVYVFPQGACSLAGITAACTSSGKTGAFNFFTKFSPGTPIKFKPSAGGVFVIGVDGPALATRGTFTLTVSGS